MITYTKSKAQKNSVCLAIVMVFMSALCSAKDAVSADSTIEGLTASMVGSSFTEKSSIVQKIGDTGGIDSKPVLEKLLSGTVFYEKAIPKNLYIASKTDEGTYLINGLFDSLKVDSNLDRSAFKKQYKKVRLNNKVRKSIKLALAKIDLTYGDETAKVAAIDSFMKSLDSSIISLVREKYKAETSATVVEKMQVLMAIDDLENSDDIAVQTAAVSLLGDRLEGPAKLALEAFARKIEKSEAQETKGLLKQTESALKGISEKVEFYLFVEKLFFGLSLGSVLLLAAIGLAITFGVMGVINMAHGEMIMIGAYTTYVVQLLMPNLIEYSLFVAIPMAFLVSGLVGILIQRTVIRHLHGRPLETLLATFGISLILQQAVRTIFSPLNRQVASPEWMSGALEVNPVLFLTYNRLYILAFSLLVFFALVMIIKKTSLGLNVRAVSQNRAMAKAMGVRTEWVDAMTFGLGSGVAGVAGVALSQLTNVGPNLGQAYIIDSFMVVVFGGVGNLMGTLVGAFTLGVANKFMEPITGAVLANILVLVFIILFIQKRPKGLFPQQGRAAE